METNQPKKKDGRWYLKRKVAKLQEENDTLAQQLHEARDMWSDANAEKLSFERGLMSSKKHLEEKEREVKFVTQMRDNICERYVWLYEHAPFWLKWWFKYTFKGAVKYPSGGIVTGSGKYEDNINRGERGFNADELQQIAYKLQ